MFKGKGIKIPRHKRCFDRESQPQQGFFLFLFFKTLPVIENNLIAPRDSKPLKVPPRNITHANPRLLQIAANRRLMECCEVLTRFGFRRKMLYFCTSKVERALNKRVFSSFFAPKNGDFTSEIDFSTLLRKFFLGVCGFFLRNVGGFLGDVERLSVKRYLFFWPHFCNYSGQSSEELSQKSCGH